MVKTYFSTDFHLGHANIIKFDSRPYSNVEDMNKDIIKNFMTTVEHGDNFFYLGDWALAPAKVAEAFMATIKSSGANLFFIRGNHDKKDTIRLYEKYGTYLGEQKKIRVVDADTSDGYQEIVLNHYGMRVWDKSHVGTWHLYGHSHDGMEKEPWGRSMDCSVVSAYRIKGSYSPFEYEEIKAILKKRTPKIVDQHGKMERV